MPVTPRLNASRSTIWTLFLLLYLRHPQRNRNKYVFAQDVQSPVGDAWGGATDHRSLRIRPRESFGAARDEQPEYNLFTREKVARTDASMRRWV